MAQEELTLCPGINCLVGDNGAGKTNVVDAVYYLSMCKSSLQMTDAQSIRHGADFFLVEGQYATDAGKSEGVVCSFSRKGGKVLKTQRQGVRPAVGPRGLIPAVIVSPADSALISDAADERRRYLNAFISQLDRPYLNSVMRYNAVLAERNRLLKMRPDETMLQIYDMQLVEHGKAIHTRRQEFAERLQPVVAEYYRILSGDREQVELHYKSELNERPFEEVLLVPPAEGPRQRIHHRRHSPRRPDAPHRRLPPAQIRFAGTAEIVPHRPQTGPVHHGRPGQGRTADPAAGRPLRQLDAGRVEQLIRLVSDDTFGQILITDCNPTRLKTILDKAGGDYALFSVAEGAVTQERAAAEDPAERPAGNAAENAANTPENASKMHGRFRERRGKRRLTRINR